MTRSHRHGHLRPAPVIAIVAFVLVTWLLASNSASPNAPRPGIGGTEDAPFVEGEVLIRFKHDSTESVRRTVRSALGATRVRRFDRSLEHLRLGGDVGHRAELEQLEPLPVQAHALLAEDDRPGARGAHERGDHEHRHAKEQQRDQAAADVDEALEQSPPSVQG